jgi:hypothetical protein
VSDGHGAGAGAVSDDAFRYRIEPIGNQATGGDEGAVIIDGS